MKTLLIGESPAKSMDGKDVPAFSSRSGQRLTQLLGCDLFEVFDTVNLLPDYPGSSGKGAEFDLRLAQAEAKRIIAETKYDRLLLAGGRVAKAFRVRQDLPLLFWGTVWADTFHNIPEEQHRLKIAVLPHPSGINRWWNDPANTQEAIRFLRKERKRHEQEEG